MVCGVWCNEGELVDVVEEYFAGKGYLVFREQWIAYRRADIVAVIPDPVEVKNRIKHGFSIGSKRVFFVVLRVMEKDGRDVVSLKYLSDKIGYSVSYLKRVLSKTRPYLELEGDKVYYRRRYRSFALEVLAVEVKLKDWRHGLMQAHDYLYGVGKSYLAIPVETYAEIENMPRVTEWMRKKGIGLLLVYPNKHVEEKIKPRKQEPLSKRARLFLLETLWNNYIQKQVLPKNTER